MQEKQDVKQNKSTNWKQKNERLPKSLAFELNPIKKISLKFHFIFLIIVLFASFAPLPKVVFLIGPVIALLLSLVRSENDSKYSNGQYFVIGFGLAFCLAPFTYFIPNLNKLSPDANFYLFGVVLNFIFYNVIILEIRNLSRSRILFHKANTAGLVIALIIGLNFYKELLTTASQKYLLNYLIKAGWDNAAHFSIFNQIYLHGTNTKIAPSGISDIFGSSYPQHLHIVLAWGVRTFQPYVDPTQSLYLFAVSTFVLFTLVSIAIFFAISAISGDKLSIFMPAAALTTGVLFYGAVPNSFFNGWHSFLFSQLLAFLTVLIIYKGQSEDSQDLRKDLYIGAFLCLLTNIWYLMGLVMVVLYVISSLYPRITLRKFLLVIIISTPALILPFYFLYPSVGVSALVSGGSPGFSWRLFLLGAAILMLFTFSAKIRGLSKYSAYSLSVLVSTGTCILGLLYLVQINPASTTYYLAKLVQGSFVIVLSCLTLVLVEELGRMYSNFYGEIAQKKLAFFLSSLLSFALLQTQVYVGPSISNSGDSSPFKANNSTIQMLLGPSQEAIRLLNASNYMREEQSESLYLSSFTSDPNSRLADLWVRALAGKWTYESDGALLNVVSQSDPNSMVEAIKVFLNENPEGVIIISSTFYAQVQSQISQFSNQNFHLVDDFGKGI